MNGRCTPLTWIGYEQSRGVVKGDLDLNLMNIFLQGREVILRYMRKGTLMNNYAHIFAIMVRLRQLCCHRELLPINWAGIDMNDLVGWAQRQIQQQGPPGTLTLKYTRIMVSKQIQYSKFKGLGRF